MQNKMKTSKLFTAYGEALHEKEKIDFHQCRVA